jgi:hypothetical protein
MQRTLLLVSLIALVAAPAAAQGKSKEHRRDDHGSQFRSNENRDDDRRSGVYRSADDREGNYVRNDNRDYNRNYRSKTQRTFIDSRGLECREKSEIKKDGRRKYDLKCKEPKQRRGDRRVSQSCVYGDTRCNAIPRTSGSAQRSISDILGEIANQRRQTTLARDPRG